MIENFYQYIPLIQNLLVVIFAIFVYWCYKLVWRNFTSIENVIIKLDELNLTLTQHINELRDKYNEQGLTLEVLQDQMNEMKEDIKANYQVIDAYVSDQPKIIPLKPKKRGRPRKQV